MPLDPGHLEVSTDFEGARDIIYTTEYEIHNFPPFSHLHNYEALCAVCRVTGRSTVLMIPAKTTCPPNWTTEYKGYLMSANQNHVHQSEYICIDKNAEARPGTDGNTDGSLLYLVETGCRMDDGSPCTSYVSGYELACTVCTI